MTVHSFVRLREQLRTKETERGEYEKQISDLRLHVQRYVNEVKRIEELFAVREKERSELLEQYKQLSVEVDSAESYGRKMEAQVHEKSLTTTSIFYVTFKESC